MQQTQVKKEIDAIIKKFHALPEEVNRASAWALNHTSNWIKSEVAKSVADKKNIKLKLVRDEIGIDKANKKNLQTVVNINTKGVLAKKLGPMTKTPEGAAVGGHLFKHAFTARWKNRSGAAKEVGMYRRTGKERIPVESVRVEIEDEVVKQVDAMSEGEITSRFENTLLGTIKGVKGVI